MTAWSALLLVLAGVAAGGINAVVGSGTLLTYPTLLAFGLNPVLANGTNTTGLCVGGLAGAVGYRRELAGRRARMVRLATLAAAGGLAGAVLVVALPESVFVFVVPWLIVGACVLMLVQPRVTRWLRARSGDVAIHEHPRSGLLRGGAVTGAAVYGGYFGAAQGVVFMAVLCLLDDPDVQRSNAAKNLLAGTANTAAAVTFIVTGRVLWWAAIALAVGSIAGGLLGARVARRLPAGVLRALVVGVGLVAAVVVLVRF
ncbi:MAG: sulfite exporter TauE/SafE family protein [Actinomycetota bacterium]|nr:MAG: sulfite exporter TauE/SafE family protein [Actinomycetota bacterium]